LAQAIVVLKPVRCVASAARLVVPMAFYPLHGFDGEHSDALLMPPQLLSSGMSFLPSHLPPDLAYPSAQQPEQPKRRQRRQQQQQQQKLSKQPQESSWRRQQRQQGTGDSNQGQQQQHQQSSSWRQQQQQNPPKTQRQVSGGRPSGSLRGGRAVGGRGPGAPVSPYAIFRAMESLYEDQLKPFGRILRKRLTEHAAALASTDSMDVEEQELRAACEACPWLTVEDAVGLEWVALLVGQPQNFVDVHSPEDGYPPELWGELTGYLDSLGGEDMVLPGGRYMCARVLVERRLPFLAGYSLGHVAHIVQLAISHKKLLGYSEGSLVPYVHSQSMLKERNAQCQRPCQGTKEMSIATWDTLREHLQQLLEAGGPQQSMPLSNLKRLFRTRFGLELSETALGHSKLSELLQDPRCRDLCVVKLSSAGLVLQAPPGAVQRRNCCISLVEGLCLDGGAGAAAAATAASSQLGAPGRGRRPEPLSIEDITSPPPSPGEGLGRPPWAPGGDEEGVEDPGPSHWLATTPLRTPFPPTPSPSAAAYGLLLPRLLGSMRAMPPGLEGAHKEGGADEERSKASTGMFTAQFGDFPPMAQSQAGSATEFPHVPAPGEDQERWAVRPLTPSTLDGLGFSVQNTFISPILPPPTPVKAAARTRANSLPRTAR